ncbi:MAG: hypothetical protein ACO3UU_03935 [Minisyncoccia bacterium]
MPKARRIILNINFKKTIADNIFSRKSIIIEFKSITEAEEKLGIDKSLLHKLLETNKELEGILAIVEGDMGFIDKTEKTETETAKVKQQKMKEHLERVANYCKKHKVNYVKTLTQCPLCKLDEAKTKFKML